MENKNSDHITFENLPKAVELLRSEIISIRLMLDELQKSFEPKTPTELLTRNEVADMLKCDLSTIHNWTKKGKLKKYCIGDRVYYKRSEIESALTEI